MVLKVSLIFLLLSLFFFSFKAYIELDDQTDHNNDPTLTTFEISNPACFDATPSSSNSCQQKATKEEEGEGDAGISAKPQKQSTKLHIKRRPTRHENEPKTHLLESTIRDFIRMQTLHRKVIEKKNKNSISMKQEISTTSKDDFSGKIIATLESGASHGSGEYFIDVFIGTPPKHVWLILDTGSDLNWIQCLPCYDCFEQNGPYYDPNGSSSFKNINCNDPRCQLVSSPNPLQLCEVENENQTCPYFYNYADGSNTTGDFSLETFTVNLTNGDEKLKQVVDIMLGCGHLNKGYFHGAGGVLGLGRGSLSFSSQLQSIYGHSFSYCLDDLLSNTGSNTSSSKLIFGEDNELLNQSNLNFTSLLVGEEIPDDTFYYLQIKSVMVGGEVLDISEETWYWSLDGSGGTIIDSGSTLTFFPYKAYDIIKEAFKKKIEVYYPIVEVDFVLDTCYNVSGGKEVELPEFGIVFGDGAVWNFPVENVFYPYEVDEVVCLAILETPHHSSFTIIGNLMQQNFHILYDTKNFRLGYSPRRCAEV